MARATRSVACSGSSRRTASRRSRPSAGTEGDHPSRSRVGRRLSIPAAGRMRHRPAPVRAFRSSPRRPIRHRRSFRLIRTMTKLSSTKRTTSRSTCPRPPPSPVRSRTRPPRPWCHGLQRRRRCGRPGPRRASLQAVSPVPVGPPMPVTTPVSMAQAVPPVFAAPAAIPPAAMPSMRPAVPDIPPPPPAPRLAADDIRRLQAALYELLECRKRLDESFTPR